MDSILILFIAILVICIVLIIITLASLPQLGDERKQFIKMKAQSFTFSVVIVLLVYEIAKSIYVTIRGNSIYTGFSPFSFLLAISIVYLVTLLIFKKKYGD